MKFLNPFKKLLQALAPKKEEAPRDPPIIERTDNDTISNSSFFNPQTQVNMAMYNFGVGGNEVKVDASEAINEIQPNKTLLVSQLTNEDPVQPEAVTGLKTVEEVFRHFQPQVEVEMETATGETVRENLRFNALGDFNPKSITGQSEFLNNLNISQEQYAKIMKQLKANKVLQSMLVNEDSRASMISALKQMAQELEGYTA